jgi:DTW domain-containing protein YfiP
MHRGLCVCALIPSLETRTRLVLVLHRFEDFKPTNTGRLAAECITNSAIVLRGDRAIRNPPLELPSGTQPLILFPARDAILLETAAAASPLPVTLIVPDGSWRQAARVRHRVPGLSALPCVALGPGAPSSYRLRTESDPRHLSTIEAVARAFGVLEGPEVQRAIERPFHAMIDRMLWVRGLLDAGAVAGGIPTGAERHDPWSGLQGRSAEDS